MGVRRTLKGAAPTQAAAAAAVAVAAAAFLKKNKKIGNAQRAKGAKKNNLDGWAAVAAARWVVRPWGCVAPSGAHHPPIPEPQAYPALLITFHALVIGCFIMKAISYFVERVRRMWSRHGVLF